MFVLTSIRLERANKILVSSAKLYVLKVHFYLV